MSTYVSYVRNVNDALNHLVEIDKPEWDGQWRTVSPRGMSTKEFRGTFITEYANPRERVLFNSARDANPFFHLMEAIWIMAGSRDVKFLAKYNSQISQFSDDGEKFHASYGWRLRHHWDFDQLEDLIDHLAAFPDSRRAVLGIWDPASDLGTDSKDIPCNDLVFFKLRDELLDMTVANRSNDAVLGAYGANAVQFSMLQEFVALSLCVEVGIYRQVSDSFHMYADQPAWNNVRLQKTPGDNPYCRNVVSPFPIMAQETEPGNWLRAAEAFVRGTYNTDYIGQKDAFFEDVVLPINAAWELYKDNSQIISKNSRIKRAQDELAYCQATDWQLACSQWLDRRQEV